MTAVPEHILITGYNGFVAPHLIAASALQFPGAVHFGLVHRTTQQSHADRQVALGDPVRHLPVTEVEGDITDGERVRQILRETEPDLIFHLAAVSNVATSWQAPANVLHVNAGGFIQLAEAVRAERLSPRIVVIGSGEQYGLVRPEENPVNEETLLRPANPYAVSKVAQDLFAFQYYRAYGLDAVRARSFNHFGPGQSANFVIASFARQIAEIEMGKRVPILLVGDLSSQRDFLFVDDVAQAYLALAERGQAGEAYNVGSGVARSIESVLHMLLELTSVEIEIRVDPERFRPVDVPLLCADVSKIQKGVGWHSQTSMEVALRETLEYWRALVTNASHFT